MENTSASKALHLYCQVYAKFHADLCQRELRLTNISLVDVAGEYLDYYSSVMRKN